MEKEKIIIVYDKMTTTKMRITKIFQEQGINVKNTSNQINLFNILSQNAGNTCVVIVAIEGESDDEGFTLIKKIKKDHQEFSIVILTSVSRREFIVKCISEGASDYVLKPFEDYLLTERVLRLLNSGMARNESILKFNFEEYLKGEIIKAKKGKYVFSLLKTSFLVSDGEEHSQLDSDYLNYSNHIYTGLKELFWQTDIFIRYGSESFLGFFPFCGKENIIVIDEKMKNKFKEMKENDENLRKYEIENTFAIYPNDGAEVNDLLNKISIK